MSSDQFDYESALDSYSDRLNIIKDKANQLIKEPGVAIRQAVEQIGTPFGVDLVKEGVKSLIDSKKELATKKLKEATESLRKRLRAQLNKATGNTDEDENVVNDADEAGNVVTGNDDVNVKVQANASPDLAEVAEGTERSTGNVVSDALGGTVKAARKNAPLFNLGSPDLPREGGGARTPPPVRDAIGDSNATTNSGVASDLAKSEDKDLPDIKGFTKPKTIDFNSDTPLLNGMTSEQAQATIDIIAGNPLARFDLLNDAQYDLADKARSAAIAKGYVKAGPGEAREFGDSNVQFRAARPRVSQAIELDDLSKPSTRNYNLLGGQRGDSTIARVQELERQASAAAPQAPRPTLPDVIAQPIKQPPSLSGQLDARADELKKATGISQEISDDPLGAAAARAKGLAGDIGDQAGVIADTAIRKGLGRGAIDLGAELGAATGVETGGLGEILGGLVTLGGVLASILSPHKVIHKPPKPVNFLNTPSLQIGL